MIRKLLVVGMLGALMLTAGCGGKLKEVRMIEPEPIASMKSIVINDFKTDLTMVNEGVTFPGLIGSFKSGNDNKGFIDASKKKELARMITDEVYANLKSRKVFAEVLRNAPATPDMLVLDGKITRIEVTGYKGLMVPDEFMVAIEGKLLKGANGSELVVFSHEDENSYYDTAKKIGKDIAKFLESQHKL